MKATMSEAIDKAKFAKMLQENQVKRPELKPVKFVSKVVLFALGVAAITTISWLLQRRYVL